MTRWREPAAATLMAVLIFCSGCHKDAKGGRTDSSAVADNSIDNLDGHWVVIAELAKRDEYAKLGPAGSFTISRGVMEVWDGSSTTAAHKRLLLGPPADPREIDIELGSSVWSTSGIFSITGDTMLLSVNFPRPKDFRDAGDGREVLKLKRVSGIKKSGG